MYWLEMHIHTSLGSVDSTLDYEEMLKEYSDIGVDGVCVAEHISFRSLSDEEYKNLYLAYTLGKEKNEKIDIYPGAEIKLPSGVEYLVYGIKICKEIFSLPWDEAVGEINRAGGIIIKSHPFRDEDNFEVVDGIEIFNRCSSKIQNKMALEFYKEHEEIYTIGCDAHSEDLLGLAITVLENRPENEMDLANMLKKNKIKGYIINGVFIEDLISYREEKYETENIGTNGCRF